MVDRHFLDLKSAFVSILAILVVLIGAPSLFNTPKTAGNMAETIAEKNQEYWHHAAQSVFKDKWVHDLQAQISEFLTTNVEWLALPTGTQESSSSKLMDCACGNGIVSRSLHPHFAQCLGIDLAEGMVAKYRATAEDLGLPESRMMAVQGNLLAHTVEATNPPLSQEQLSSFDLVAICMALHHVDDIELAIKRLAERLRPGGVLLVIDWATRDSSAQDVRSAPPASAFGEHYKHKSHPASHTITHDSFTREQIFGLFEESGCEDSSFVLADRLSEVPGARTGSMQLFFARASKL
ncbi:unnamed protein product [Clonostachys byssicola]|uniref:Methyltransferase type 11 domain-containing protein n=1 Tax=Clonostachys byssicola TaxID=160290 RepID=A0A9N9XXP8_9HYPO|nr:unnamed protein product [Clonostachys byssicola]